MRYLRNIRDGFDKIARVWKLYPSSFKLLDRFHFEYVIEFITGMCM